MAYNNIDRAVTIPQNHAQQAWTQQLFAQSRYDKQLKYQEEKEAQRQRDAQIRYVGDQFADKDFMTGSPYDPITNQELGAIKQDLISMTSKPGYNPAEVQYAAQKRLTDLNTRISAIKAVRANVDQQAKAFEKYPGIDANALRQVSITNAFFDVNPKTGQRTLKPVSELDLNRDYIGEVMRDNPELVLKGDQAIRKYNESFKPVNMSQLPVTTEDNGVTVTKRYDAFVPATMELMTDSEGWGTGIKVRSKAIPEIKTQDGKPFEVADDDLYNSFMSDPGSAAYLNKALKDFNKTSSTPIDPSSQDADLWRSRYLFEWLNKNNTGRFTKGGSSLESAMKEKADRGIPLYRQGLSDAAKLLKTNEKLQGLDPSIVLRGAGGDPSVIEGASSFEDKGKTFYDLTDRIGGMKMGYDADHKVVYAKSIAVDPVTQTLRVETENGAKEYKGQEIRRFFKEKSTYNGMGLDQIDKALNLFIDSKGNYVGKKNGEIARNAAKAQAQKDLEIETKLFPAIEKFQPSGDLSALKPIIGAKTNDGGIILDIKRKPYFHIGKNFYLEIQRGDKTEKPAFNTTDEVANYIKEILKP